MTTLNLTQATKLYYGNAEIQKLYQGAQLLYPITNSSFLYWRVDYNRTLSEIQVSFDGNHIPLVLNSSNNIDFSRLPAPLSANLTQNTGALNNNLYPLGNAEYIGTTNINENNAYKITLPNARNLTSLWISPQGGGPIYNVPSYLKLYSSTDGTQWNFVKEWVVSTNTLSTINSPFTGTLLRPGTLIEFLV